MKSWFLGVLMAAVAVSFVPSAVEAKRIGGGASKGMQRSTPTQNTPAQNTPPTPAQPAAPANPGGAAPAAAGATAAGAAAAGKRSWLGPIAGLAAGLGLAALFSHLGLGDELASFVMIALLVAAAFFIFRFFMRRNSGTPRLAAAGAGSFGGGTAPVGAPAQDRATVNPIARTSAPAPAPSEATPAAFTGLKIGSQLGTPAGLQIDPQPAAATGSGPVLPEGFDLAGFERLARLIFIRMQAANDAADINDLRNFTTPELFAELRLDLQERGPAAQHTDVLDVQAAVVDFAQESDRQVVSVRYRGRVQEAQGVPPEAFDEVWHLVKPLDDSRNWAIAGIQQSN